MFIAASAVQTYVWTLQAVEAPAQVLAYHKVNVLQRL